MARRQTKSECYSRYFSILYGYENKLSNLYTQLSSAHQHANPKVRWRAVARISKRIDRYGSLISALPARASRVCEKKKD